MKLERSKEPIHVEDPIIVVEAKAKTKREAETLVAINFAERYKDLPPSAEVLEALEYAAEVILEALHSYKNVLIQHHLQEARARRLPPEDPTDLPVSQPIYDPKKVN